MIIDAQHHHRVSGSAPADLRSHVAWMDKFGIDLAVVTSNTQALIKNKQSVDSDGLSTWQKWNDELTEMERERPDRFVACPSIPIFDGKAAVNELERVVSSNEARAVLIQPFNWRIDQDYLSPLYEKLNDLRVPIFFHPVYTDLDSGELGAPIGFAINTTYAICRFMTSGLLDANTHLKMVVPHLGGTLPFAMGRLELKNGKYRAARPVSEYLDFFCFDVVSYSKKAFDFAASVLGPDRLVYGTDFGCPGEGFVQPLLFKSFVEGLPIGHDQKQRIFGQNLADLLKIQLPANEQRSSRATPYQSV